MASTWASPEHHHTRRSQSAEPPCCMALARCFGGLIAPPSLSPPSGLTFLEDDGLAQLLGAYGEILLLTGGNDGLQVIVAFLWGSRATAHVFGAQQCETGSFKRCQIPAPTTQPARAKVAPSSTLVSGEGRRSSKKRGRVLKTAERRVPQGPGNQRVAAL